MFLFDRVFSDRENQQDVWEYLSDGVNSFVQGYNVSIMAYGQSGAGKSYTMGTASPAEHKDTGECSGDEEIAENNTEFAQV